MKEILQIIGGFLLLVVILFAFKEPEKPEILHGHNFVIERNGEYLANIPRKADGVTYFHTGWGPKSQAKSYGQLIDAYEDMQEWGGRIVIKQYDLVTQDEKELP